MMTDEKIIDIFKYCIGGNSEDCYTCVAHKNGRCALPDIDEQIARILEHQKAEIDELRERISYLGKSIDCSRKEYNRLLQKLQHAQSEAIYKLVNKFKDRIVNKYEYVQVNIFDELDNLVKEMTRSDDE